MMEKNSKSMTKASNLNPQNIEAKSISSIFLSPLIHPVRLELSNKGKLFLLFLYTLLCVLSTFSYLRYQVKDVSFLHIQEQKEIQKLIQSLEKQTELANSQVEIKDLRLLQNDLSQRIRQEIISELKLRSTYESKIIQEQEQKIQDLKLKLSQLLKASQNSREIASLNGTQKTISYSWANENVLRKEQEVLEQEFKEQIKDAQQSFLSIHDLSILDNQEKWKEFKNNQDLNIYKLRQAFEEERRVFRKNKYRIDNGPKKVSDYFNFLASKSE